MKLEANKEFMENLSLQVTVRHVFVGFVEGMESGIRNPECEIRHSFKCHLLERIV